MRNINPLLTKYRIPIMTMVMMVFLISIAYWVSARMMYRVDKNLEEISRLNSGQNYAIIYETTFRLKKKQNEKPK